MFSRLSSFFAQAAEATTQALVGQHSKEEEFQGHWKTITDILISDADNDPDNGVKEITTHLDRMSDLICQEEYEKKGSMGNCMEFVLRHKLLDMLVATAKSDYPAGMRKTVFIFFTLLLGRIEQPLLPHVAVHRPINQLIRTCGLSSANPLAVEEIQFLRMLCLKLQRDSTLANFFIIEEKDKNDKKENVFVISEALMRISNSDDSLVCLKAFECLLLCVTLADPLVTSVIATSQFPLLLASKMKQHLQLLPSSLHYSEIINRKAGWGVNYASSSAVQCLSPSPQNPLLHLEAYLSWLDYCEQIVAASPEVLRETVCLAIREQVIQGVLLQKLSLSSEMDLVVGVAILNKNLKFVTHERLRQEFIYFILHHFWDQLIQCCNHLNEDVCCVSLILLLTLLHLPLLPRLLSLDKLKEKNDFVMGKNQLEMCIKSYLSIIPAELLSAHEVGGDSEMTYYLLDAHRQISECGKLSEQWKEESNELIKPFTREEVTETPDNGKGEEPHLITILLDRLEKLLDQTYEFNLHLTAVLSRLAAYSHPLLDLSLFSTRRDLTSHRNVYSILKKVSHQLQSHADRSPGLQMNIVEARRRLTGQETSDLLSMPNNELLEGAVVLEEFIKELAAILYTKHSLSLLISSPSNSPVHTPPSPSTDLQSQIA